MKPLSLAEIHLLVEELRLLEGSQLQELVTTATGVLLGVYHQQDGRGDIFWIQIDASQNLPLVMVASESPANRKKTKSPLHLFLVAHARGRRLARVFLDTEVGRGIVFQWGRDGEADPCTLHVRLIPSKVNLIAACGKMSVSWRKVSSVTTPSVSVESGSLRNPDQVRAEWNEQRLKSLPESSREGSYDLLQQAAQARAKMAKDIQKKQGAIKKMQQHLVRSNPENLMVAADWIRDHWSLQLPAEIKAEVTKFPDIVDLFTTEIPTTLAALYERMKHLKIQFAHQQDRILLVENEVVHLQLLLEKTDQEIVAIQKKSPPKDVANTTRNSSKREGATTGKRLNLTDSEFVVVGRSAAENLQILRDAQPWDYWIHLKDLPSAHGIIRRHRGKTISDEQMILSFHFVLKMTPKVARHLQHGDRVEGLIAECRYVNPLKGDHLGRVTVKESRTLVFKFDPQK